jgi:hypothetical protein
MTGVRPLRWWGLLAALSALVTGCGGSAGRDAPGSNGTAVAVLRRRHPVAAGYVVRYWTWLPVLAAATFVAVAAWPVGPLLAAIGVALVAGKPDLFRLPSN